jgi:uncharacterized protein YjbI with pentapeptide repeats
VANSFPKITYINPRRFFSLCLSWLALNGVKMTLFKKKEKTYPYLGFSPFPPKSKNTKISLLNRLANWLDNWHFTRVTASLSSLALILTLPMLWVDLFDRFEQRTTQAWQLVTTNATGNSGKRQALEYLNENILFFKERSPLTGVNLYKVYLIGIELPNADLSGADLRRAELSGADLRRADLRGADVSWENLREADLRGVDLSWENLREADLRGIDLSEADLSGVNLSEAVLIEESISGANFSEENLRWEGLKGIGLSEADLSGADLSGADLRKADLSGAVLSEADLSGADLSEADLSGADLSEADLSEADLRRADLSEAKNLTQTQLNKACGNEKTIIPRGLIINTCH